MPYTTVITFSAGNALAAADLNSNFSNLDYLNAKINQEIQIGAGSMIPRVTTGATFGSYESGTNTDNYVFLDFPDGSVTAANFGFILPSDYDGGTMTAKFIWTANSTSTNSVVWNITGGCIADGGSLDVAMGTVQVIADANKSTAYYLSITGATPAITLGGTPAAGKWVEFTVYRDPGNGSDTLAATARLIQVVLTYTRS